MTRSVPEWIGATPDTAIPPRVKVRVFEAAGKCCQKCSRPIVGKDVPEFDHIVALVNGGEHRESNLQVLCQWCHKKKTRADVAVKAKAHRVRTKHAGFRKPRTIRAWRKFNGTAVFAPRER